MASQTAPAITCSDEEWAARLDLAACYRIFDYMGWSESIYNHISLRVPGEENSFLINPFGLLYDEVSASNLVKIDIDGNVLAGDHSVNKAGFTQHSYFHKHLDWAHAICHTHTTETAAVCAYEGGLEPTNFYSANLVGKIGYHDFEGVTIRPEEGERLIANLADHSILMLRNHGPVVMAPTLPAMFVQYQMLQRACEIQLASNALGNAIPISDEVFEVHQRDIGQSMPQGGAGVGDFEAWKRKMDRVDPSWRE